MAFLYLSCKDKSTQPTQATASYNQMLFDREGGGNLIFTASTSSRDTFQITVTKNAYRDTSIQRTIARNTNNSGIFDMLIETLNGNIQVTGSFKQDTAAIAGTWAYIYMVNDSSKSAVTNVTLRNTLLRLEPIVRATL